MATLLYRWSQWTDGAAVRGWGENIAQHAPSALVFLRGFVQMTKQQGFGSLVTRQIPRLDLKSLENFVSLDAIETTLRDVEPTDSSDQQAVKLFRKALGRRRKGLPDQEPLNSDEDDDE